MTAALVLAVAVDHIVGTVYLPRRSALRHEIRQLEAARARAVRLRQDADAIRARYEALRGRVRAVESVDTESAVLRAIERLAANQVQLVSVDPTPGATDAVSSELPVTMQFQAPLAACSGFLLSLAQELDGELSALSISPARQPGAGVRCQATCTFTLSAAAGSDGSSMQSSEKRRERS